jgi:hypothetical protein
MADIAERLSNIEAILKKQFSEDERQTKMDDTPNGLKLFGEDVGNGISDAILSLADAIEKGNFADWSEVKSELQGLTERIASNLQGAAQEISHESEADIYLKRILNDNEDLKKTIQTHIGAMTNREVQLDRINHRLKDVLNASETTFESADPSASQVAGLEAELEAAREEIQRLNDKLAQSGVPSEEGKDLNTQPTKAQFSLRIAELDGELQVAREEIRRLNDQLAQSLAPSEAVDHLKAQLAEFQELSIVEFEQVELLQNESTEKERAILSLIARTKQMVDELAELKGNVRVVCRIKPEVAPEAELLKITNLDGDNTFIPWTQLRVTTENNYTTETKDFSFQRVFGKGESNQDIFKEVKDFALTAILGRPTTIVGYGATGTGKSHTFLSEDGLIHSYISLLFQTAEEERTQYEYIFHLSALEIYLNKVYDLLEQPNDGERVETKAYALSAVRLESQDTAFELIQQVICRREVASTSWNATSSRSHAVISLKISRRPITGSNKKATEGIINFVDLAGSEPVGKVMKAGPQDIIAKQGTDINVSLQQMGRTIRAVADGAKFIPPGSHSLSKLLKSSLTSHSRLLVIVTVSPLLKNKSQTDHTLSWCTSTVPVRPASTKKRNGPEATARTPEPPQGRIIQNKAAGGNTSNSSPALRKPVANNRTPSSTASLVTKSVPVLRKPATSNQAPLRTANSQLRKPQPKRPQI